MKKNNSKLRILAWLIVVRILNFWFLHKKLAKNSCCNCVLKPLNNSNLDIITIAFNNEFLIEEQIRLVKKYILDKNYTHIIVDNSSDIFKRKLIRDICIRENVAYVSIPKFPFMFCNHGFSLNYTYRNIISVRKPAYFGLIDHDIFPTKPYSISDKMANQDFYGTLVNRVKGWYLWAGFCFFNYNKIKHLKINFLPYKTGEDSFLDTGGGNYPVLYSKYDKEELKFAVPIVEKSIREGSDYLSDFVHFIDNDWLHTINGSNWAKGRNKDDIIKELLKQY